MSRRRPLPVLPRMSVASKAPAATVLLGLPRFSPEWELSALQALMRPQEKGRIAHRHGKQSIRRDLRRVVESIWSALNHALGELPELHFPTGGEYVFIATFDRLDEPRARAAAIALSAKLFDTWIVAGTLFIRGGVFFRRQRKYRLRLVRANDIHLSRLLRAAIKSIEAHRDIAKGEKEIAK